MSLKTYHKKRNFNKTTEPKGKSTKNTKTKNLYIIQKHAASHLHYDFRLELNGVLLSWAVPKGPCLDPTVKRLAMHVEDHPVEYGAFEGIIPKGSYGAGTVMLWDKGKWYCEEPDPEEAYKKGKLTFTLKAKKLNGRWKIFRINKDDKTWLLVKADDEFAKPLKKYDITIKEPDSVLTHQSIDEITEHHTKSWDSKAKKTKATNNPKININLPERSFPKKISPMLATLVDEPPEGKQWLHEIKYDGYRLIAFKNNKSISLVTRNHNNWTSKFPTIKNALALLPIKNAVFDGEIVVLDKKAKSDFQLLQNAISDGGEDFVYYLFDLLYYDKYDLTTLPLIERKNILQKIISPDTQILRYSEHLLGSGKKILSSSCKLGLEGIISKDAESLYLQKRSPEWQKSKCTKSQEFIIGGLVAPLKGKRELFRSLMLGSYNKKKELIYHGNVGTGFTKDSIKELYKLFKKYATDEMPFAKIPPGSKNAIWLKPLNVAEVEFTEWTDNNTLRHPSFKGLRIDKPAKEIVKEKEAHLKKTAAKKITKTISKKDSPIKLTHPEKILYPEAKITKSDVFNYYEEVQEWILPYIINRPLTILRCPEDYTKCFYQKHTNNTTPPSLHSIVIKEAEGKSNCIYINDKEGLLALPQLGTLEIHPWGSKIDNIETPDIIVFDLDPAPELAWKKVVEAAFEIKNHLEELKLKSFIKTTGGKGLHVVVPIKPKHSWAEIKNFTHVFANCLVEQYPKKYLSQMSKEKRTGKIFIDYLRNQRGANAIAPYSTRARPNAPIATPLHWDELTNNYKDTYFTIKTILKRLETVKDPWKDFFKTKQSLRLD